MKANMKKKYQNLGFLETKLILLSKLTNTEKLLMCIKYSEAKVSETCPFEIIFLYMSLKYCALGTTGIQEHPFHTDLKYAMYSLLYQPKLNFRFLHLNQKRKKYQKALLLHICSWVNSSCKYS